MLASSGRLPCRKSPGPVWLNLQAASAGWADRSAARVCLLIAVSTLVCLPVSAQYRSGYPAHSSGVYGMRPSVTNLPPGTGLNGILGSRNPGAGLNGLPTLQNRPYRLGGGCFNCGRIGRNHDRDRDFDRHDRRGRNGYGYGTYPFIGGYVPVFDNYSFDGDGYSGDAQNTPKIQPDASTQLLGSEIYRLKGEVDRLKNQQNPSNTLAAQQATPPSANPSEERPESPAEPATVIVLRNGNKLESTNYAIMNQTLWNFTAKPVQKIPLSSIDLSASERANAERGVDFSIVGDGTN
jgi:hypothetical protein